jgi:hypothetical protein
MMHPAVPETITPSQKPMVRSNRRRRTTLLPFPFPAGAGEEVGLRRFVGSGVLSMRFSFFSLE